MEREPDVYVKTVPPLWHGELSQNSAEARNAMVHVCPTLLKITPRSPELNPIDNFFHIVTRQLDSDVISLI